MTGEEGPVPSERFDAVDHDGRQEDIADRSTLLTPMLRRAGAAARRLRRLGGLPAPSFPGDGVDLAGGDRRPPSTSSSTCCRRSTSRRPSSWCGLPARSCVVGPSAGAEPGRLAATSPRRCSTPRSSCCAAATSWPRWSTSSTWAGPTSRAGRAARHRQRAGACATCRARLVSGTIRKTNLVQVSYLSQRPELAASVVQQVTDAYLAAHLAVHSSPGTYELFKTQAADGGRRAAAGRRGAGGAGSQRQPAEPRHAEEGRARGRSTSSPPSSTRCPPRCASSPRGPRWPTSSMALGAGARPDAAAQRAQPVFGRAAAHAAGRAEQQADRGADQVQRRRPAGGRARSADHRHHLGAGARPGAQRQRGVHRRQPGVAGAGVRADEGAAGPVGAGEQDRAAAARAGRASADGARTSPRPARSTTRWCGG